jgi:ArsR family transcriptional regulator, virulence genes transcriptional regulator
MKTISSQILPKMAFKKNAKLYKILANEKRLEILNNIKYNELSAEKLLKITKLLKSNFSIHLSILKKAGLVKARKEGKYVYYKIIDPRIIEPCLVFYNIWKNKGWSTR